VTAWPIYTGAGVPHDGIDRLPEPPNWRRFDGSPPLPSPDQTDPGARRRLGSREQPGRVPTGREIQMINAALFLRRVLLVTGRPGTGKSSLAYSIAEELRLGPVLRWAITSRSTLLDGLYRYDPIGRLREENLRQLRGQTPAGSTTGPDPTSPPDQTTASAHVGPANDSVVGDIGRHLRLGPLGTALLPYDRPRVLLIDEIDKSDIDLPNDLLNVFEEGEYEIDELARLPEQTGPVQVMTADSGGHAPILRGRVRCRAFPFVLLTSNGEREFPPAFLRRCLSLDLQPPDPAQVSAMVTAHLGADALAMAEGKVEEFLRRREHAEITTDQLLNAVYLVTSGSRNAAGATEEHAALEDAASAVLRPLAGLDE
jgi:MoxR-like ATPase